MKRISIAVPALVAGAWLFGCSSAGAPAPAAPTPARPSTSTSSSAQPTAAASSNPLPTQGEYPGITAGIQELKRGTNGLTLRFVMANNSSQGFAAYYYLHETQAHSVDGVHLIDPVGKKKYFVMRDSDGACVCSREIQAIAPGGQSVLWAKFPAPPDDVQKITVEIPHFPPFEDVPVTR